MTSHDGSLNAPSDQWFRSRAFLAGAAFLVGVLIGGIAVAILMREEGASFEADVSSVSAEGLAMGPNTTQDRWDISIAVTNKGSVAAAATCTVTVVDGGGAVTVAGSFDTRLIDPGQSSSVSIETEIISGPVSDAKADCKQAPA